MSNVKKKLFIILLLLAVALCMACGERTESKDTLAQEEMADGQSAVMEGTIDVADDLPERDIKIPDHLTEESEGTGSEGGEESVYHMTGEEQAGAAREIAEQIEDSINQVLADKDFYPDIVGISVNPECTEFNVTFSGRELSLYENTLRVSLCIVGDRFQLYQGKGEDELLTVVNYIDADSGEIFSTMNSREIE